MKATDTRNDQRGFISLSVGFALLAVFGTISAGIEMAHRNTDSEIALGKGTPEYVQAQDVDHTAR